MAKRHCLPAPSLRNVALSYLLIAVVSILASCSKDYGSGPASKIEALPALDSKGWQLVDSKGNAVFDKSFASSPSAAVEGRFAVATTSGVAVYSMQTGEAVKGCENFIMAGAPSQGLFPAVKDGERIAIYNLDGEVKATLDPVDGKEIVQSDAWLCDGMLRVVDADGNIGFFDGAGSPLVAPKYEEATTFNSGVAAVKNKAGWVIINKKGDVKAEFPDGAYPSSEEWSEGYLPVKTGDRCAIMDTSGKIYSTGSDIDSIGAITSKYFIYKKGETFGLRNLKGEQLLATEYLSLYPISTSRLMAHLPGGQWAVITTSGKVKREIEGVEGVEPVGSAKFGFKARFNGRTVLVTVSGKIVENTDFEAIDTDVSFTDVILSDFADSSQLRAELNRLITSAGIGGIKPGDSMDEIVKKPAADLLNTLSYTISDGANDSGDHIRVNVISDAFIATGSEASAKLNPDALVQSVVLTIVTSTSIETLVKSVVEPIIKDAGLKNAYIKTSNEGITVTLTDEPEDSSDDALMAEGNIESDSQAATIYRVLLFSSSDEQDLPESNPEFLPDPVRIYRNGIYLYCAGAFTDKAGADKLCVAIRNRYSGARVISFRNGNLLNYRAVPALDRRKMPDHHIISEEELQAL